MVEQAMLEEFILCYGDYFFSEDEVLRDDDDRTILLMVMVTMVAMIRMVMELILLITLMILNQNLP